MLCKGYAEANNKLLKSHNTNKPTSYIIYLDANNLYVYMDTMTQPLPTEILDWVNPKDFSLDNYSNDCPIGCSLEVVLDYPDELHDLHNVYPLASQKIELKKKCCPTITYKS